MAGAAGCCFSVARPVVEPAAFAVRGRLARAAPHGWPAQAKRHGTKSGSGAQFRRGCSLRRAQLIGSQSVLAILGLVPCEVDQESQIAAEQPPTTCSRQSHGATLRAPLRAHLPLAASRPHLPAMPFPTMPDPASVGALYNAALTILFNYIC